MGQLPRYIESSITESLYCERCGYNLRTLPTVGICPECGGRYSTDKLPPRGILLPEDQHFPLQDAVTAALCWLWTLAWGMRMWASGRWTAPGIAFGVVFVFGTLVATQIARRTLGRWWLFRCVSRDERD